MPCQRDISGSGTIIQLVARRVVATEIGVIVLYSISNVQNSKQISGLEGECAPVASSVKMMRHVKLYAHHIDSAAHHF